MDPSRAFGAFADEYDRYRPHCAAETLHAFLELIGPDCGTCLDVGAGTGQSSTALAPHCKKMILVEPDEAMASRVSGDLSTNLHVKEIEQFNTAPDSLDGIVCASSFHWLDREKMIENSLIWLRPGGYFLITDYAFPEFEGLTPDAEILIRDERNKWDNQIDQRLCCSGDHARLFSARQNYDTVEESYITQTENWDAEHLAGFLMTLSYARSYSDNQRSPEAYREAFGAKLKERAGRGSFKVQFPVRNMIARKTL